MRQITFILLAACLLLPAGLQSKSGPPVPNSAKAKRKISPSVTPAVPGNTKTTVSPGSQHSAGQPQQETETQTKEKKKPKKGHVIIEFTEGSIQELIKHFSELLSKNFTYDESIKGKVTLIGPTEVTKWQARKIFESSLERMGYVVIWGWPINKIVPISQAKSRGNVPVID